MECYHCGAQLGREDYCSNCGADVKIYKRIIRISNLYYNEGLEKASVRNLSGAVESLKKSLQLNKMNTSARNLLGLVYFEMGETVAALSEWVISKNFQRRNNIADKYLGEVKNSPSELDAINQTIKKYNQALLYCRQDSKDLAIIQLKKVISLNPKLVKAHQLLALLYIQEEKYEQAKKALKNAGKIDENNTTTLRYLKEVNQKLREGNPKKQNEDIRSYKVGNDTIITPAHLKEFAALPVVINIAIGIALGLAVALFLIMPNMKHISNSTANEALKTANNSLSTKEQTINSLNSQIDDLKAQLEKVKGDATGNESVMNSYEQLISAYAAFVANDVTTAGTDIAKVNKDDLSDSAKTVYDDVSAKVNEQYMKTLYQDGYSAYSKNDFTTAIDNFTKIIAIDNTYEKGNAVYYLAQSYRRNNQLDQAVQYYQMIVDTYPGTERANTSNTYLKQYKQDNPYGSTTGNGTGNTTNSTTTNNSAATTDNAAAPTDNNAAAPTDNAAAPTDNAAGQ